MYEYQLAVRIQIEAMQGAENTYGEERERYARIAIAMGHECKRLLWQMPENERAKCLDWARREIESRRAAS